MNRTQKIIHELLFSEDDNITFDLSGMLGYIEDYPDLVESIVRKINRGSVKVIKDTIMVQDENVYWELKIKRS